MTKLIRIYFAQQPKNPLSYEIWRNGIHTKEYVTDAGIKKMLDKDQYKKFLAGDTIFDVPVDVKEKSKGLLIGRINQTFKFKKQ